ncbi:MAG: hypothetical protein HOW73_27625 [Polyangiaceae bacterium]|nr:hypothetical protein [Polyangiaceae bacterium]
MIRRLELKVPLLWAHVRDVRTAINGALVGSSYSLRQAAEMTASELIENAIKYGEPVSGAECAGVTLASDDDLIVITVVNGSTNDEGVHDLMSRVDQIAKSSDRDALYLARLQELISNPAESGKLGLYRIGFEGGFDLSCTWENQIVTMVAKRGTR